MHRTLHGHAEVHKGTRGDWTFIMCSNTFYEALWALRRGLSVGNAPPQGGTGFQCLRTDHEHDDRSRPATFRRSPGLPHPALLAPDMV